ncbi:MAG: U32 family peptidase [Candidatus Lokiarchaeota archaeon]|nr:U32 family peptidase [Candidatus Lokiarchaeota archaeon]
MRKTDRVELLAPCRNWKALKAAEHHADAIYFGTHVLNLRQMADNFEIDELPEIAKYCHDRKMKAYLTVNAIVYDNELDVLKSIIETAKAAEIDAVIIHDLAAVESARDAGMAFHMSTQANISNTRAARFYEKLGARRLILARELSLERIKAIVEAMDTATIEVFVHGAMCTAISGRCYLSLECMGTDASSGNRGTCAQPCRRRWRVIDEENNEMLYTGDMFLSSKDLCMIEHVPKLVDAGITAFKIEGRMRDPFYVETVARCYKEAITSHYEGTFTEEKVKAWLAVMGKVFNRGFTTGFYFGRPTEVDIEHHVRGSVSHHRQVEIGKVNDYLSKTQAAKIILTNGRLRIGDEIFFVGHGSKTYFHMKIEAGNMRIQGKDVTETPVADAKNHLLVSIKTAQPVKKNDHVSVFTDETYENFLKGRKGKDRYQRRGDDDDQPGGCE